MYVHIQLGMGSLLGLESLARQGQMTDSAIVSLPNGRYQLLSRSRENWRLAAQICTAIQDWVRRVNIPMDIKVPLVEQEEINLEGDSRRALRA